MNLNNMNMSCHSDPLPTRKWNIHRILKQRGCNDELINLQDLVIEITQYLINYNFVPKIIEEI